MRSALAHGRDYPSQTPVIVSVPVVPGAPVAVIVQVPLLLLVGGA
jgi:hypothetical protein